MEHYDYRPDAWVLMRNNDWDAVFCGWGGGYTYGASWKRSSPIVSATKGDDGFYVKTESGSTYFLHQRSCFMIASMEMALSVDFDRSLIYDEESSLKKLDEYANKLR